MQKLWRELRHFFVRLRIGKDRDDVCMPSIAIRNVQCTRLRNAVPPNSFAIAGAMPDLSIPCALAALRILRLLRRAAAASGAVAMLPAAAGAGAVASEQWHPRWEPVERPCNLILLRIRLFLNRLLCPPHFRYESLTCPGGSFLKGPPERLPAGRPRRSRRGTANGSQRLCRRDELASRTLSAALPGRPERPRRSSRSCPGPPGSIRGWPTTTSDA